MSLDTRIATAVEDLLRTTDADPSAGLGRLKRMHRRRRAAQATSLVVALVLVAGGAVWSTTRSRHHPEPVDTSVPSHNGMLVSWGSPGIVVVDGELAHLPTDLPRFPNLAFSADGHELLYVDRDGRVVAFDHRTGSTRMLAACPDEACMATVSPDTTQVAISQRGSILIEGPDRTWSIPLAGLTPFFASWSPDGSWLAFASQDGMHVVRADGTGLRQVADTEVTKFGLALPPAWSPDGRRLAFLAGRPGPPVTNKGDGRVRYAVTTVDLASGERRSLAAAGACFCLGLPAPALAWSPDGRLIAFVGTGSRRSLFVVPAEGGQVQVLSTRPAGGTLAWQPLP